VLGPIYLSEIVYGVLQADQWRLLLGAATPEGLGQSLPGPDAAIACTVRVVTGQFPGAKDGGVGWPSGGTAAGLTAGGRVRQLSLAAAEVGERHAVSS
jgi:hypothetical protein